MLLLGRKKEEPAARILAAHEKQLEEKCLESIKELLREAARLEKGWNERLQEKAALILTLCKGREALRAVYGGKSSAEALPENILRFQISRLLLDDCREFLTSDPKMHERLHLVTGTITPDGIRVLSRMEHVKLEKQSAAYVRADEKDAHLRIVELSEKHGHPLLAVFHSHISQGAASTTPSDTDIKNQDRLTKLQCEAIGGIFSLDGFVRFFSTWKPFEIDVYGKNVRKILDEPKNKIFQLLD